MPSISEAQRNASYQKELYISWKRPEGGNKLVILNLNDGDFYSLEDPVSMEIWEKLLSGLTPVAILDHLASLYPDQDRAELGADMDRFLGELLEDRLVSPCSGNGAST